MLNINDFDQIMQCNNGNRLYRKEERIAVEDVNATKTQLVAAKYIRFFIYLFMLIVLPNMVFAIFSMIITTLPAVIIAMLILSISMSFILYWTMVIVYEKNNRGVSLTTNILLLLTELMFVFELSIMTMVLAGSTNYRRWIYIVLIVISSVALVYALSTIIISFVTKQSTLKRVIKTVVTETSDVEIQIESAKDLLGKNLITEEEYSEIKAKILSRYF